LYVVAVERERFSNDQVDQVLGHLFSGLAVFHAGRDRQPMFTRPDGREYPPEPPRLDPRLRQLVGLRT